MHHAPSAPVSASAFSLSVDSAATRFGEEPARVLVASDIRLFREALAESLSHYSELALIGTVDSCDRIVEAIAEQPIDIVVFDASMVGVLALVRRFTLTDPRRKFVAVAVTELADDVIACAEAGVSAYVPRDGSVDLLVSTLDHVRRGELLCSPLVAASLFRRLAAMAAVQPRNDLPSGGGLTQREVEIVGLLARGLSNKEIAGALNIEVATVKNHVHNILEKLHVKRRSEAAARLLSTSAYGRV
jgi:two-component system nitrate/nitrite response regulator NarL